MRENNNITHVRGMDGGVAGFFGGQMSLIKSSQMYTETGQLSKTIPYWQHPEETFPRCETWLVVAWHKLLAAVK